MSDDCDSHGLKPSLFYRWQKEFFENGAAAFEKTDRRTAQAQQRRTAELEARLKKKGIARLRALTCFFSRIEFSALLYRNTVSPHGQADKYG